MTTRGSPSLSFTFLTPSALAFPFLWFCDPSGLFGEYHDTRRGSCFGLFCNDELDPEASFFAEVAGMFSFTDRALVVFASRRGLLVVAERGQAFLAVQMSGAFVKVKGGSGF